MQGHLCFIIALDPDRTICHFKNQLSGMNGLVMA